MTEDEAEELRLAAEIAALLADFKRLERSIHPVPPPAPGSTIES